MRTRRADNAGNASLGVVVMVVVVVLIVLLAALFGVGCWLGGARRVAACHAIVIVVRIRRPERYVSVSV
jgi:hypothetical protein